MIVKEVTECLKGVKQAEQVQEIPPPTAKSLLGPPFDKDAIKSMLTENVQESGSAAGCIRD